MLQGGFMLSLLREVLMYFGIIFTVIATYIVCNRVTINTLEEIEKEQNRTNNHIEALKEHIKFLAERRCWCEKK